MSALINLLLLLPAIPIAYEDFRMRRVAVVWFIALAIVVITTSCIEGGIAQTALNTIINIGLLALLCGSLWVYLYLRKRSIKYFIGLGDLCFMIALAPLFTPEEFVRFMLLSCLLALGMWYVMRWRTIPLAGVMGIVISGYAICKTAGVWS